MDRELLAHFLRVRHEEAAAPDGLPHLGRGRTGHLVGPVMARIVERLSDHPATVFSRFGEVLLQTRPAIALFGDYTRGGGSSRSLVDRWFNDPAAPGRYLVEAGVTGDRRLRRYRHAELGRLELYRQLLLDPVAHQVLVVYTAVPGSASDEKLGLLAAGPAHDEEIDTVLTPTNPSDRAVEPAAVLSGGS